jgi:hypothetical protein
MNAASDKKEAAKLVQKTKSGEQKLKQKQEEVSLTQAAKNMQLEKVAQYTEERDYINLLLGQTQMAVAISKFTNVMSLSKLKEIKENKLYRALKGQATTDKNGKTVNVGTWAGFCKAIGTTASKVDEDLLNLSVFGESALENLNEIGLGYRKLRKLRQIPEDTRETIINGEAVQLGDKDEIVALIDDMTATHTKKTEELESQIKDLKEDSAATNKVMKNKSEQIDDLSRQIERRSVSEDAFLKDAEVEERLVRELQEATLEVKAPLAKLAGVITDITAYNYDVRKLPEGVDLAVKNAIMEVLQYTVDISLECRTNAPVWEVLDSPDWQFVKQEMEKQVEDEKSGDLPN